MKKEKKEKRNVIYFNYLPVVITSRLSLICIFLLLNVQALARLFQLILREAKKMDGEKILICMDLENLEGKVWYAFEAY